MNAMHEERDRGSAPGGAVTHLPRGDRACRQRHEAIGQPVIRSLSEQPVALAGHAFAGVLYSTAGASPKAVGLVCIAALAADDVPMPIGLFYGGPMPGDVTEQHLAGTKWVIVPLGRTIPPQREPAAWLSAAKVLLLESSRLTLLPRTLEQQAVIIDAAAVAGPSAGSGGTP